MTDTPRHDPLQPHAHDPNPHPPSDDPSIVLRLPDGVRRTVTVADLRQLPQTSVSNCFIVSTEHGASGPFTFRGVRLRDLILHAVQDKWDQVEVISADGFGNRVFRHELESPPAHGPILLAIRIDDRPLERQEGLVRLIVPGERDDALRQVKWVAQVNLRAFADADRGTLIES